MVVVNEPVTEDATMDEGVRSADESGDPTGTKERVRTRRRRLLRMCGGGNAGPNDIKDDNGDALAEGDKDAAMQMGRGDGKTDRKAGSDGTTSSVAKKKRRRRRRVAEREVDAADPGAGERSSGGEGRPDASVKSTPKTLEDAADAAAAGLGKTRRRRRDG